MPVAQGDHGVALAVAQLQGALVPVDLIEREERIRIN